MENILDTLKQQHLELKKQLEEASKESSAEKPDCGAISHALKDFEVLLKAHLMIEDGIFYPKILEKMQSKGMQTAGTEAFIKQMGVIAKDVYGFLNKYNEPPVIEENLTTFKQDLKTISSALVLRVTSEEDGVYLYWNL